MRRLTRRLATLAVLTVLATAAVAVTGAPAPAQSGSGDVGAEQGTNYAGVSVRVSHGGRGSGGGGGGGVSCTWGERVPSELLDSYEAYSATEWTMWDGKVHTGSWFPVSCSNGYSDTVFVPDDMPPVIIPMEDIVAYARRLIQPIAIEIGMNPAGDQVVTVPTWLYINADAYTEMSATASVTPPVGPGLEATVTADPYEVQWDMGDGGTKTCLNAGVRYDGGNPLAESDCSYKYTRAASGYTVQATLKWRVRWSASNGGGGFLADLTSTDSVTTRVLEVQTIN